jgi:hypothetical protein
MEANEKEVRGRNDTPMCIIKARAKVIDDLTKHTEKQLKEQNIGYRKLMERKYKKIPRMFEEALKKHKQESLEISNILVKL